MKDTLSKSDLLDMGKIVFIEGDSSLHGDIKDIYDDFTCMGIPCEKIESIYESESQVKFLSSGADTIVVQSAFLRDETFGLFNNLLDAQKQGALSIKNVISIFDSAPLISACNQLGGNYIQIGMKLDNETYSLLFNTLES